MADKIWPGLWELNESVVLKNSAVVELVLTSWLGTLGETLYCGLEIIE